MGDRTKYIVIDRAGLEEIIIFSDRFQHSEMAQAFNHLDVVGAGFISFDCENKANAWGESISLNVKARTEKDTKLANRMLNLVPPFDPYA